MTLPSERLYLLSVPPPRDPGSPHTPALGRPRASAQQTQAQLLRSGPAPGLRAESQEGALLEEVHPLFLSKEPGSKAPKVLALWLLSTSDHVGQKLSHLVSTNLLPWKAPALPGL